MTDADRQRLTAILGMLGSNHAGERAAAALQAEAFRKKHGIMWDQLVGGQTIFVDRIKVVEKPIYVDREVVVERVVYREPEQRVPAVDWRAAGSMLVLICGVPALYYTAIILSGVVAFYLHP